MKLVNYWDKYTEMYGQQNVKISKGFSKGKRLITNWKLF